MFASLSAALRRLSSTQNDRSDSDGISQLQWIWFTSCPPFPSHFRTPNGGTLMDLVHLKCKLLITPLIWIEQYIYIYINPRVYVFPTRTFSHPSDQIRERRGMPGVQRRVGVPENGAFSCVISAMALPSSRTDASNRPWQERKSRRSRSVKPAGGLSKAAE